MGKPPSYFVYIMANEWNNVLYVGVTNNLARRISEHRQGHGGRFTSKYNLYKLVFIEEFQDINDAIRAEKYLKKGSRARKTKLIESINPEWTDLADSL